VKLAHLFASARGHFGVEAPSLGHEEARLQELRVIAEPLLEPLQRGAGLSIFPSVELISGSVECPFTIRDERLFVAPRDR